MGDRQLGTVVIGGSQSGLVWGIRLHGLQGYTRSCCARNRARCLTGGRGCSCRSNQTQRSSCASLLHHDCAVQHVHPAGESDVSGLGRRELNHYWLIQWKRSFDVQRRKYNLCPARLIACAHKRDTRQYAGAQRHSRRLIALFAHDHFRSLCGLAAASGAR